MSVLDNILGPALGWAVGGPLLGMGVAYSEHKQRQKIRDEKRRLADEQRQLRQRTLANASARGISGSTTEKGYLNRIDTKFNSIYNDLDNAMGSIWKNDLADFITYYALDPNLIKSNWRNLGGITRDIQKKGINYFTKSPSISWRNRLYRGFNNWNVMNGGLKWQ